MSSSEKKAWKIFRPANISFIFTPLSAGHIYDFHIFTIVYSPLHGFIWNQHDDQLPVGLLAQLVEHCTSIAEVMGLNPIQAWIFFQALIFTTAQVVFITAKISFIFMPLSAVQVYDFHIFTVVKNCFVIWLHYNSVPQKLRDQCHHLSNCAPTPPLTQP